MVTGSSPVSGGGRGAVEGLGPFCTIGVVVTYVPSKDMPRFRLPDGAYFYSVLVEEFRQVLYRVGSLAQMVERSLCMREVMGSMPVSPKGVLSTAFPNLFEKKSTRAGHLVVFFAGLA